MKFYFVFMQCPHSERFYNIGDFKKLDDAIQYASNCQYYTKIKECTEEYSTIVLEGNLLGTYKVLNKVLSN